jgi:hypothetical protein
MSQRIGLPALILLISLAGTGAPAQTAEEQELDKEVALLRKDLRSEKKQIIAANLTTMTDKEAEKFWPVYDRYADEVAKVVDVKYALIKQYAQHIDTLTDEMADQSARRWLALDQSIANIRLKYLPVFRGILSGKNTARFFQIERRLANLIDLQVASTIPLVQP